jgi:transcriptional regulator with XRE-family HTH domain
MSIKQRFKYLLKVHNFSQKDFAEESGYGISAIKMYLTGRTKVPKVDLCEAVKKVFPHVNLNWFIMGEEPKWVSPPPFNVDPDWSATGNAVENIPAHEAKLLEESSAKEIAQAESIVMKLLLRELKRMRQDMKTKNPELIEEYGLDELLDDILE